MTVDVGLPTLLSCKLHAGGLARARKRLGGLPIRAERLRRRGRGIVGALLSTHPSERSLLQTPVTNCSVGCRSVAETVQQIGGVRAEVRAGHADAMTT
jgi:hypothetical protein